MKTFLRLNWFKVGIIVLGTTLLIIIGLYLYSASKYREQIQSDQITLERTKDCERMAAVERAKMEKDYLIYSFEYKFISRSGSCVIAYVRDYNSTSWVNIIGREFQIRDLFSGRDLYKDSSSKAGAPMLETQAKFDDAKGNQLRTSI